MIVSSEQRSRGGDGKKNGEVPMVVGAKELPGWCPKEVLWDGGGGGKVDSTD